jgi:Nidogen-like
MRHWWIKLVCGLLTSFLMEPTARVNGAVCDSSSFRVLRGNCGFQQTTLVPITGDLDDGYSGAVDLGFTVHFFGSQGSSGQQSYSQLYVNINGNVTLDEPSTKYEAEIASAHRVIIAPFFSDVDLSGPEGTGGDAGSITYGQDVVDGHKAFGVNWLGVGRYNGRNDLLNTFQVVIIDRSDVQTGAFDVEFNYDSIAWDISDGVNTPESPPARVGFSNGSDQTFELIDDPAAGTWVDSNLATGLINGTRDAVNGIKGRYVFQVRGGAVEFVCDPTHAAKQCGDGIACTDDACDPSDPDADPHTGCTHHPTCSAIDDQCAECQVQDGACVAAPMPDGTGCDTGDSCVDPSTGEDACMSGTCQSPSLCSDVPPPPVENPKLLKVDCGTGGAVAKGDFCQGDGVFTGVAETAIARGETRRRPRAPVPPGTVIYKPTQRKLSRKTGRVILKLHLNGAGKRLLQQSPGQPLQVSIRVTLHTNGSSFSLARLIRLFK